VLVAVAPTCAPPAAVSGLKARLAFTYVDAPPEVPGGPPSFARELRLRPSITNTGPTAVDLFGVTVPITFSHRVKPDAAAPGWAVAPAADYVLDCYWAQVVTSAGAPVYGQPNACEYMSVNATATGLLLQFQGGRLCAGCTLAGAAAAGDATVNAKHATYLQMDVSPPPAVGQISCTPLPAPPARCAAAISPLAAAGAAVVPAKPQL
jgi:hypothetical protein